MELPRTWTFVREGKLSVGGGSAISVKVGGSIEATYLRSGETSVTLKLVDGNKGVTPLADLSSLDRDYVATARGFAVDELALNAATLARKSDLAQRSSNAAAALEVQNTAELAASRAWQAMIDSNAVQTAKRRAHDDSELERWKRTQRPNWHR